MKPGRRLLASPSPLPSPCPPPPRTDLRLVDQVRIKDVKFVTLDGLGRGVVVVVVGPVVHVPVPA